MTKSRKVRVVKSTAKPVAADKAVVKATAEPLAGPVTAVQEALQITWLLKGDLKNKALLFLRIGEKLARVRDNKLYAALKHPTIEQYAFERLGLKRASLYDHLQVYDWALVNHPEWLKPKPKGFIPDFNDCKDLIWIENELAKTDLDAKAKKELIALQKKGLSGKLAISELSAYKKGHRKGSDARQAFLSSLRDLRRRGGRIADIPPAALSFLDSAIAEFTPRNS